eukprot:6192141-Pleurochrysis_carterae.AAC.3
MGGGNACMIAIFCIVTSFMRFLQLELPLLRRFGYRCASSRSRRPTLCSARYRRRCGKPRCVGPRLFKLGVHPQ